MSERQTLADKLDIKHWDSEILAGAALRRINELTEALGNLVSALGDPACGEISDAAEAAVNKAIDVLAK